MELHNVTDATSTVKKGNNNCFTCGKFGHKAADCRSKGKTQFKIKVRSVNDEETTKQIDELKKQIEETKRIFPKVRSRHKLANQCT
jgi:hypothetical protein